VPEQYKLRENKSTKRHMNTPENKGRETPISSTIAFDKFIEPAAIITIIVAATYYVGRTYISSYYGRLGLDANSLEFPTAFYVQQSAIPVLIGVVTSYISFSLPGKQYHKGTRKGALFGNILLFVAGLFILYVGLKSIGGDKNFYIVIASSVLAATSLLTYLGVSFSESIKTNFLFRLGALVAMFALFVLTAQTLGNYRAVSLIRGDYRETLRVDLHWKDIQNEPAPQTLDTDLILLMQNKGNYYIVKKQDLQTNQANGFPEIYIVPEENIKFAVIKKEIR
jgi:hypothetical protein